MCDSCATGAKLVYVYYFFFNDTATTEIYTLSLHDALPIFCVCVFCVCVVPLAMQFNTMCERSEEHTSELQSHLNLVCRLLLEKKIYDSNTSGSSGRCAPHSLPATAHRRAPLLLQHLSVSHTHTRHDDHPHTHTHFFFNDTAPTEIYTLSLHDALPISHTHTRTHTHVHTYILSLSHTHTHTHRSEEHTSELQSHLNLVCTLLLEQKNKHRHTHTYAHTHTRDSHHALCAHIT